MAYLTKIMLAVLSFGTAALLLGRAPLSLKGAERTKCAAAACAVNLWVLMTVCTREISLALQASRFFLANGLFLMTVTDLREKMVYDIHFYTLLLVGIASAFAEPGNTFIARCLAFLLLFGVLFLVSRKSVGIGMGDIRMIACLALYFSLSGWMEVMLLSLGTAMIYGLAGVMRKKQTLKTEMAFIPFLLFAVLIEFVL